MGNGFTDPVESGYVADVATFALRCARGLDYCSRQSDHPMEQPPRLQQPDPRYLDLIEAKERVVRGLLYMDQSRLATQARNAYEVNLAYRTKATADRKVRRDRVQGMLTKIATWIPPHSMDPLKRFMTEQLDRILLQLQYEEPEVVEQEPMVWYESVLAKAREDLAFYHQQAAIDARRCSENNAWIRELYAVLDLPVPTEFT